MVWNKFMDLWYNKILEKQFIPVKKDIKNSKKLAERLKGKSDAETLNNILEWQERNILYWTERGYLEGSLYYLILLGYVFIFTFISIPVFIFLFAFLTKIFLLPQIISAISSMLLTTLLFLWVIVKASTLAKLIYLILWSFPLYEFIKLILLKSPAPSNISTLLNLTIFNWAIFGIAIFSLCYLFIIYRSIVRNEKSLITKFEKISNLVISTFKSSLSTFEILEYKMAICRDYAKLTASILLNLYPNNRIFFFTFPGHVATGIKINKVVYILDQKLPVLNETAWLIRWNKKNATKLELKRENGKYSIEYVGKISLKEKSELQDLKDLIEEIEKAIKLGKRKLTYTLKGKAKIYDVEDEIIKESLLRKIKLFLENEMVGNFPKIKKLDITKKGNDLVLHITLGESS